MVVFTFAGATCSNCTACLGRLVEPQTSPEFQGSRRRVVRSATVGSRPSFPPSAPALGLLPRERIGRFLRQLEDHVCHVRQLSTVLGRWHLCWSGCHALHKGKKVGRTPQTAESKAGDVPRVGKNSFWSREVPTRTSVNAVHFIPPPPKWEATFTHNTSAAQESSIKQVDYRKLWHLVPCFACAALLSGTCHCMITEHHIEKRFLPSVASTEFCRTLDLPIAALMKCPVERWIRHEIVHVDLRVGQRQHQHFPFSNGVHSVGSIFRKFTVLTSRNICSPVKLH